MWIRSVFLIFYGICAGSLIAASFLAFLSMQGCMKVLWQQEESLERWYLFTGGR